MKKSAMDHNWMQGAVKHPGGLHRALGIPMGEHIPMDKIEAAKKKGGKIGRMANLAAVFSKFRPGK